jgi:hypothetical protein
MKKVIIDRFEDAIAVIEHLGNIEYIPKSHLPVNAKEGDVVVIMDDGKMYIDEGATTNIREKVKKRMDRLWED